MNRIAAVALVPVLAACSGGAGQKSGGVKPGKGQPISEPEPGIRMTLPRLGGGSVAIEDLRGHPVVIILFTTWSLRSQAEAPAFVRLHERLNKQGLRMLGIALDHHSNKVMLVQTYVEYVGFRFPVLLAQPESLELVGALGATKQVPRTVLLDRVGRIVQDHGGQTNFLKLREGLQEQLTTPRTPRATVK